MIIPGGQCQSQLGRLVYFGKGAFQLAHLHYFSLLYMGGDFAFANKSYAVAQAFQTPA